MVIFSRRDRLSGVVAFTLMEVLIAIVIAGVIASLAIPNYFHMVEQARENEAKVNLQVIRTGEKVFALNHNGDFFGPGANPPVGDINKTLNIDISTEFFDIVSMTAFNGAVPKTFKAIAQRNKKNGGDGSHQFVINQDGVITEDFAAGIP